MSSDGPTARIARVVLIAFLAVAAAFVAYAAGGRYDAGADAERLGKRADVPMERSREGEAMIALFAASRSLYGHTPRDLSDDRYLTLIAVMIAPSRLSAAAPDVQLAERVARIERLVAHECMPHGHRDVWLEDCATPE